MIKKDFIYRFLTYLIMISAILLPWFADAKYNQDLLVMVVYLKTVFEQTNFIESFNDNITLLYVIRKCLPLLSPYTLVFILHNIAVVLLTFTLKKYLRPIYVCAIMLFSFFTIFCNQFRLAYALVLGLNGFMVYFHNKKKGVFLIILSLFFHVFVAFFILSIFLIDVYNRGKRWMKNLILFMMLLATGGLYLFVTNNSRFALYLTSDESSYVSTTFILVIFAVLLLWKSIDKGKKIFVVFTLFLVIVSAPLSNISSRLGELLFLLMPFISRDAVNFRWSYLWDSKKLLPLARFLYFLIGVSFFVYRFYNWVVMGKVIRPDILDLL